MVEMTESILLEAIRSGYLRFKELLVEIEAEQMTRPGAVGKWSVKDTVAHAVAHEQRMIEWITERLGGGQPAAFQPYAMPEEELDKLNEQIYQENLNRSLEDVLAGLDQTHTRSLRLVARSAEADLLNPECFHLRGGEPLWAAVAANTFEHYQEHGQDIRRYQQAMR